MASSAPPKKKIYNPNVVGSVSKSNLVFSDVVHIPNGGTGLTYYETGDLLYSDTSLSEVDLQRLTIGNVNQLLTISNGRPVWSSTIGDSSLLGTDAETITFNTKMNFTNTTPLSGTTTTASTNASIYSAGGVFIEKDLYVGGNLIVVGDDIERGTEIVSNLEIESNFLFIGSDNYLDTIYNISSEFSGDLGLVIYPPETPSEYNSIFMGYNRFTDSDSSDYTGYFYLGEIKYSNVSSSTVTYEVESGSRTINFPLRVKKLQVSTNNSTTNTITSGVSIDSSDNTINTGDNILTLTSATSIVSINDTLKCNTIEAQDGEDLTINSLTTVNDSVIIDIDLLVKGDLLIENNLITVEGDSLLSYNYIVSPTDSTSTTISSDSDSNDTVIDFRNYSNIDFCAGNFKMLVNGDVNDEIYFLPYQYDASGTVNVSDTTGITLETYNGYLTSDSDISMNHIQIASGTTTDSNYSMILSARNDSDNTGYIQCVDTINSTSTVIAGDLNINSLGGTLTIGSSTSNSDTYINGILSVTKAVTLESSLYVADATSIDNSLYVTDATTLESTLRVDGEVVLKDKLYVDGTTIIDSSLNVMEATTLDNTLYVGDITTIDSSLNVTDATTLESSLYVGDATTLDNTLYVNSATTLNTITVDGNATVSGTTLLSGSLTIDGNTSSTNSLFTISGTTYTTSSGSSSWEKGSADFYYKKITYNSSNYLVLTCYGDIDLTANNSITGVNVILVGGGGGGGNSAFSTGGDGTTCPGGGGGGELVNEYCTLTEDYTYTVSIGSGGGEATQPSDTTHDQFYYGSNGSETKFSGDDISYTAYGGQYGAFKNNNDWGGTINSKVTWNGSEDFWNSDSDGQFSSGYYWTGSWNGGTNDSAADGSWTASEYGHGGGGAVWDNGSDAYPNSTGKDSGGNGGPSSSEVASYTERSTGGSNGDYNSGGRGTTGSSNNSPSGWGQNCAGGGGGGAGGDAYTFYGVYSSWAGSAESVTILDDYTIYVGAGGAGSGMTDSEGQNTQMYFRANDKPSNTSVSTSWEYYNSYLWDKRYYTESYSNTTGNGAGNGGDGGKAWDGGYYDYSGKNGVCIIVVPANTYTLSTDGNVKIDGNLSVVGNITYSGELTSSSDDRLKHNETEIEGLALLNQLKPQKYLKTKEMYEENYVLEKDENGNYINLKINDTVNEEMGIIAQDLQKIKELQFCVSNDYSINGIEVPLSVSYNNLFVLSIKAIQELNDIVNVQSDNIISQGDTIVYLTELVQNQNEKIIMLEQKIDTINEKIE